MYSILQLLFIFIFNNFCIGSSFKNPIISRVPEDCSDLSQVIIDEILTKCRKESHIFYVIYDNHSMYVRVEGITKDHLPIIRLRNQPKNLDSNFKEYLKSCQKFDDYLFDDYTYSLKSESESLFIGFNYLWLGCPQSLCFSAVIDAATSLPNGTVYVFRGNYYWDLRFPAFVGNAHKITNWSANTTHTSDFDHGYFNAVVTNRNFTSFYRNDRQYIWDLGKIQDRAICLTSSEFQLKMDASFYVLNDRNEELTYDLRGNKFVTNKNPFAVNPITNMGIPWDRVDAAYGQNKTIYLFKDSYYIRLAENIALPVEPRFIFKDIYNCSSNMYKPFGGYQSFLKKLMSSENMFDQKNDTNTKLNDNYANNHKTDTEFDQSITIMIIITVLIIISFIILKQKQYIFISKY